MKKIFLRSMLGVFGFFLMTETSFAETTMSAEGQYIFNSLAFYIGCLLYTSPSPRDY